MLKCKICDKKLKSIRSLSIHLLANHKMSLLDYYIKYEDFETPKCPFCGKNSKHKTGLDFRITCGDKECYSKIRSLHKHTEETKQILRKKRLDYIKNNPNETSGRLGNEPSGPEKIFIKALKNYNGVELFAITREKCFFPYYVDFAFENVKVAVEIDGSQHLRKERIKSDRKKDQKIQDEGGRIYRVSADKVLQNIKEVLNDLGNFIGKVEIKGYTCDIKTDKEINDEQKKLKKEKRLEKRASLVIHRRNILDNSEIDISKHGGLQKVSDLGGLSRARTKRYIDKYYPDLDYYKRK